MHQIALRPAAESDIDIIYEITQEAFKKYSFDLSGRGVVKALSETPEAIAQDLENKHIIVGELDGDILGSIRYEIIENIAYISRFGVKLKAQGCGMGRALVQNVITDAKQFGCRAVALHTSSQMSSLIRFYYGNGFFIHSVETSKGYYRALLVRLLQPEDVCFDYRTLVGHL